MNVARTLGCVVPPSEVTGIVLLQASHRIVKDVLDAVFVPEADKGVQDGEWNRLNGVALVVIADSLHII